MLLKGKIKKPQKGARVGWSYIVSLPENEKAPKRGLKELTIYECDRQPNDFH